MFITVTGLGCGGCPFLVLHQCPPDTCNLLLSECKVNSDIPNNTVKHKDCPFRDGEQVELAAEYSE